MQAKETDGINRRDFLKLLGVLATRTLLPDIHQEQITEIPQNWEELVPGTYYYGFTKEKDRRLRLGQSNYDGFYVGHENKGYIAKRSLFRIIRGTVHGWVEIAKEDRDNDSKGDNGALPFIPSHPYARFYLPFSELAMIDSKKASTPIAYVTSPEGEARKFAILEKTTRELTYFEGSTPILKIPVVINTEIPDQTPVGIHQVLERHLQTNMATVDGVPYTAYFTTLWHALHGSPWRDWTTMTHKELMKSETHGCVNQPSWLVTVGPYKLPADEFIFRWLGGQKDPEKTTVEFAGPDAPHVVIVNDLADLSGYDTLPEMNKETAFGWNQVMAAIRAKALNAPPYFSLDN